MTRRVRARVAERSDVGQDESARRSDSARRIAAADLTSRELEVLVQIGWGRSNTTIARTLDITLGTAKTHVSRILTKLGIESRTQAALLVRDSGLQ